ncbi:MAG: hypothetical protein ACLTSS_04590, partial [Phocaeicola coprocola]
MLRFSLHAKVNKKHDRIDSTLLVARKSVLFFIVSIFCFPKLFSFSILPLAFTYYAAAESGSNECPLLLAETKPARSFLCLKFCEIVNAAEECDQADSVEHITRLLSDLDVSHVSFLFAILVCFQTFFSIPLMKFGRVSRIDTADVLHKAYSFAILIVLLAPFII